MGPAARKFICALSLALALGGFPSHVPADALDPRIEAAVQLYREQGAAKSLPLFQALTTEFSNGPQARNHAALASASIPGAAELAAAQQRYLDEHGASLRRRAEAGCIVEGHGDLRPEHVFVNEHPAIIDCLEFDRDLRLQDRAEELCFLELECARLGHAAAGRSLRGHCLLELGDTASTRLLDFYRSHRAATRAKVFAWRSSEPDGNDPAHWLGKSTCYAGWALEWARSAIA